MSKSTHKSSADLSQEVLNMRMSIEAMREQVLQNFDALLARIDQVLPAPEPDARFLNPSKIDWKEITRDW